MLSNRPLGRSAVQSPEFSDPLEASSISSEKRIPERGRIQFVDLTGGGTPADQELDSEHASLKDVPEANSRGLGWTESTMEVPKLSNQHFNNAISGVSPPADVIDKPRRLRCRFLPLSRLRVAPFRTPSIGTPRTTGGLPNQPAIRRGWRVYAIKGCSKYWRGSG